MMTDARAMSIDKLKAFLVSSDVFTFKGNSREETYAWIERLSEARRLIEQWRFEYNEMRPHSSLGNRAPAIYVAELLGVGTNP